MVQHEYAGRVTPTGGTVRTSYGDLRRLYGASTALRDTGGAMNENILDSILFFLFSCGALFAASRLFSQLLNRRRLRAQDATPQLE
jgi:hypothetical protein